MFIDRNHCSHCGIQIYSLFQDAPICPSCRRVVYENFSQQANYTARQMQQDAKSVQPPSKQTRSH